MERNFIDGYLEWQANPEITGVNKLPPHADLMPYDSLEEAMACKRFESSQCKSLNGKWKFKLYKNYAFRPSDFAQVHYDSHNWETVQVPHAWNLEDNSICGEAYPWEGEEDVCPPNAPTKYNPVGCYVKKLTIGRETLKKRIVICFEGVASAFYLYVNGERVGYSESSFNRTEFDITRHLAEGSNVIGVEVYRFSTGSWLECDVSKYAAGIFRDVYIYTTEREYIRDFTINAEPNNIYTDGYFDIEVKTNGAYEELSIDLNIFDKNGEMVALDSRYAEEDNITRLKAIVINAGMWSAEKPELYTFVLTLKRNGMPIEYISGKFGFRTVEIEKGVILFNGKRLVLKGANLSGGELDCMRDENGRPASMTDYIENLKSCNFNAVLMDGCPASPKFYELCDEYGIYVIDENNLNTKGTNRSKIIGCPQLPASRPEWEKACMDRVKSLYFRDKNRTSVIGWSLGRDSLGGENLKKMHEWLKKQDKHRFVMYECYKDANEKFLSDVQARKYAPAIECEEFCLNGRDGRPFILTEFGGGKNSCGALDEYTKLWDKYPQLSGGFVKGVQILPDLEDFSLPSQPEIFELSKLYQNVEFKAIDAEKGLIEVKNKYLFTNLNEFEIHWKQYSDKGVFREGVTSIDVQPGQKGIIDLELNRLTKTECYLDFDAFFNGKHVAFEQFVINEFENVYDELEEDAELVVADSFGSLRIFSDDISVRFEKRSNNKLSSITVGGEELLKAPVRLNFWRALTENDRENHAETRLGCWRNAGNEGAEYSIEGYKILSGGKRVVVTCGVIIHTEPQSRATIVYEITSKGIEASMQFLPDDGLPEIPEVSMLFELPADFSENITYLGAGGCSNYIDRKSSARLGIWNDITLNGMLLANGENRTGVRYATLVGEKKVFSLVAEPVMEMNICNYLPTEADYAFEPDKVVLRAIARQMGVGSHVIGIGEKYKNKADKTYRLKLQIRF